MFTRLPVLADSLPDVLFPPPKSEFALAPGGGCGRGTGSIRQAGIRSLQSSGIHWGRFRIALPGKAIERSTELRPQEEFAWHHGNRYW